MRRDAGAEVVDISLPHTKYPLPAYYIIAPAEASSNLARYDGVRYGHRARLDQGDGIVDMYQKTRAEGFGAEVRRRVMIGTYVLSAGYYDAHDTVTGLWPGRDAGRPGGDVFAGRVHHHCKPCRTSRRLGSAGSQRHRPAAGASADRPALGRGRGAGRGSRAGAEGGFHRPARALVVDPPIPGARIWREISCVYRIT